MLHDIRHRPSYALFDVTLESGEAITAGAEAMVSHTDGVEIETDRGGGLLSSVKSSVLGGKSFFRNTFTA